ncbi:MAG: DNA polymerase III subunit delta [Bacteroidales bacterium]|nr:DNA polymerase III subunit delta [Bacteroidales bacterium]
MYEKIIADLKQKQYHPVYFLSGDEPYYIDLVTSFIQTHVLNDSEKTFNQTILYGKDADAATIVNTAKRFPMMASHQVVIVKEAQEINDLDQLEHYIEKPLGSTLLVLHYKHKKPDKRRKIFKSLMKNSVFLESKKLYDDQVPGWISAYVSSKDFTIEPKAAALLVEFLGNDLSKIANEIDKLIISVDEGTANINASFIERNIGISKDYNNFELHNALGCRDVLKANRIINYFGDNQKNISIQQTIGVLYTFFSKLLVYFWIRDKSRENLSRELGVNIYFVKDYQTAAKYYNPNQVIRVIELLREYDLKSKGYQGTMVPPGELLKELIFKILH